MSGIRTQTLVQIRFGIRVKVVVFNATLNTISDISWRPVLLRSTQKKHRSAVSH